MLCILGLAISCGLGPARAAAPGPDFELSAKRDKGALLIATRMPAMDGAYTSYALLKVFYHKANLKGVSFRHVPLYRKMAFKKAVPSDYGDGYGLLQLVEVPAGTYVLDHWQFFNGTGATYSPREIGQMEFTIQPGRATYVGSFDLSVHQGENVFGADIAINPWVFVSDQWARDREVLARKFPRVDPSLVDVAIIDAVRWAPADDGKQDIKESMPAMQPLPQPGT